MGISELICLEVYVGHWYEIEKDYANYYIKGMEK
jgi:hypothetical protein